MPEAKRGILADGLILFFFYRRRAKVLSLKRIITNWRFSLTAWSIVGYFHILLAGPDREFCVETKQVSVGRVVGHRHQGARLHSFTDS